MVYFVHCEGFVKIGYSTKHAIRARLSTLQTSCPYDLELLKTIKGTKDAEAALHHMFAHLRIRGEWFKYTEELRGFIDSLEDWTDWRYDANGRPIGKPVELPVFSTNDIDATEFANRVIRNTINDIFGMITFRAKSNTPA